MQYYSGDWKLGYRSKSHMSEFSRNPDPRKKAEVKYHEYKRRLREASNQEMSYRVEINKIRDENGLEPFRDQETFDELIDECELEGETLWHYLCEYNGQAPEEPTLEPEKTLDIAIIRRHLTVESRSLAGFVGIEHKELEHDALAMLKEEMVSIDGKFWYLHRDRYKMIPVKGKFSYWITYQCILALVAYSTFPEQSKSAWEKVLQLMESRFNEYNQTKRYRSHYEDDEVQRWKECIESQRNQKS